MQYQMTKIQTNINYDLNTHAHTLTITLTATYFKQIMVFRLLMYAWVNLISMSDYTVLIFVGENIAENEFKKQRNQKKKEQK